MLSLGQSSSGGAEVHSFDLDALLMSLEIEKVESELIKFWLDRSRFVFICCVYSAPVLEEALLVNEEVLLVNS